MNILEAQVGVNDILYPNFKEKISRIVKNCHEFPFIPTWFVDYS